MHALPVASNESKPEAAWVMLAVLTQPHGVSGRIKVKSFTEPQDEFATHANLTDDNGNPVKLRITGHTQGMPIVTIEGITRRDQAELIRGKKLGVMRSAMPVLEKPNRFYTHDLIGMTVVNEAGQPFGKVLTVANYGAGDILDITRIDGKREMYAFTDRTFPSVDLGNRRIVIHPPELLE